MMDADRAAVNNSCTLCLTLCPVKAIYVDDVIKHKLWLMRKAKASSVISDIVLFNLFLNHKINN